MIEAIENIRLLEPTRSEIIEELNPLKEAPILLNRGATEAANIHRARVPASFLLSKLSGGDGVAYARSMISQASMLRYDSDRKEVEEVDAEINDDLFIAVSRSGPEVYRGLIVQTGVTVLNDRDELVIDNGTCIEAFSRYENNQGLPGMYEAGLAIAEVISKGSKIFAIESAPDPNLQQKKGLIGLFSSIPKFDPSIRRAIGAVFKEDDEKRAIYTRTDMPDSPFYGQIFVR